MLKKSSLGEKVDLFKTLFTYLLTVESSYGLWIYYVEMKLQHENIVPIIIDERL